MLKVGVALTCLLVSCATSKPAPDPEPDPEPEPVLEQLPPRELPVEGNPPFEAAQVVKKGDTLAGDVPYLEAHHLKFALAADEKVIFRLTTRIPGEEIYPTTRMQVLDATGAPRMEWRSSLWKSQASFTADVGADYVLRIENAQFPEYPHTIHYTVTLE